MCGGNLWKKTPKSAGCDAAGFCVEKNEGVRLECFVRVLWYVATCLVE